MLFSGEITMNQYQYLISFTINKVQAPITIRKQINPLKRETSTISKTNHFTNIINFLYNYINATKDVKRKTKNIEY